MKSINRKTITGLPPNFNSRLLLASDIVPAANNLYTLGLDYLKWRWAYLVNLTVSSSAFFSGLLTSADILTYGDITISSDPVSTLGGNLSVEKDVTCVDVDCQDINCLDIVASGDVGCVNVNASGNLDCLDIDCNIIDAVGDVSCDNVVAAGNVGCDNVNANGNVGCVNLNATGNVGGVNVNATGNVGCVNINCTDVNATNIVSCNNLDAVLTVSATDVSAANQVAGDEIVGNKVIATTHFTLATYDFKHIIPFTYTAATSTTALKQYTISYPVTVNASKTHISCTAETSSATECFAVAVHQVNSTNVVVNVCRVDTAAGWSSTLKIYLLLIEAH